MTQQPTYGPHNPHPLSQMRTELVWEGKYKEQSTLEMVAYRDMWGKGADSYLYMMYERFTLIKELLSDRGSLYVHCDWRVNNSLKLILDEIFGQDSYRNEIIWHYGQRTEPREKQFDKKHDTLLFFAKPDAKIFQNTVPWSREEFVNHRQQKNIPIVDSI